MIDHNLSIFIQHLTYIDVHQNNPPKSSPMFTIRPKTALTQPLRSTQRSFRRRDLRDVVSVNSSLGALVSATQWRRALQLWEEAETEPKLGPMGPMGRVPTGWMGYSDLMGSIVI